MSGPPRRTPISSSAYQCRPSNVANVCPRQKSAAGARTRITTSSLIAPRTDVSIDWAKPV
jgi:hypothetical protein